MTNEDELRDFQKKLWKLIEKYISPDKNKSNILMVSGALLSTCLKLYVLSIGKKSTVNMFNIAIESIKDMSNEKTVH
jgi:hypothetical protein